MQEKLAFIREDRGHEKVIYPIAYLDNNYCFIFRVWRQKLAKNNVKHPEGDPQSTQDVITLMFGSIPMALTSQFCENEEMLKGVESVGELLALSDVKVTSNKAHDYTLTEIQKSSQQPYEINAVYDPTNGGIRMVEKTGGKVTEFFEFIPLGSDQYAFQTNSERGIVNFKDRKTSSFVYTKLSFNDSKYSSESDSIYPSGTGASMEWAVFRGEDGYEQYFNFDGKNIKLSMQTFKERIKTEIPS